MPIHISKSKAMRTAWHRQVQATGKASFDDGQLAEFPPQLLLSTKEYLARKRMPSSTTTCDTFLRKLVNEHIHLGYGYPEIAVLACLSEFSHYNALSTLISLRGDDLPEPSYSRYLRTLLLAPAYVTREQAELVQLLLQIRYNIQEPLVLFQQAIATLSTIPNWDLLPPNYINRFLIFCKIPPSYALYIQNLESLGHWYSLYRSLQWISEYFVPQRHPRVVEVLREQVPQADMWACWKPNELMLQEWEAHQFTPDQIAALTPVFLLEGPDTTMEGLGTLKDAVFREKGGGIMTVAVAFDPPTPATVKRLYEVLLRAMRLGPHAVDLVIQLCVKQGANNASLSRAAYIVSIGSSECCVAALSMATSCSSKSSTTARISTLTTALPVMQAHPPLRECYAATLVDDVTKTMTAAQSAYSAQLEMNIADSMGYKIHAFGKVIREAKWLRPLLPEAFIQTILGFPKDTVFDEIMAGVNHSLTPVSEKAVRQYLLSTLAGAQGFGHHVELLAAVREEQEFWLKTADVERNRLMVLVRELPGMTDVSFVRSCREQILVEDVVLVRDLLGLVERHSIASCIDMLRILARRVELPCGVHSVWVGLLAHMMQQHHRQMLVWACNNLTVKAWFRWVEDLQMVLADRPEHSALLMQLRITPEREYWWKELQKRYREGVEIVDQLQRKHTGGLASLKWLYLEEVHYIQPFLDVLTGNQILGYDVQWILSFYDASINSVVRLCNFLKHQRTCSQIGRQGVRAILSKHHTAANWTRNATRTHLQAWLQHPKLKEADKMTLRSLSELMQILPTANEEGLTVFTAHTVREYNSMMDLASDVERVRLQLTKGGNEVRTLALARDMGMQNLRRYGDPAIPPDLCDSIENVGDFEYELSFPLTHLTGYERKVRGIGSNLFPLLVVRVLLRGPLTEHGFCLHMVTHESGAEEYQRRAKEQHAYCFPAVNGKCQPPASRVCTTNFNLFTHSMAHRLFNLFHMALAYSKTVTLQDVFDQVTDGIKRPGGQCTMCGESMSGLWKPTFCTRPGCITEMSKTSLLVRAYGLLVDAPVLDFLLGCLYAASKDTSGLQLVTTDCPFEKDKLSQVINSFPALPHDDNATPFDLLAKIRADVHLRAERENLLAWMSKWFRGCMLTAPSGMRVPNMAGVHQFLMFNSTPECEKAFNDCIKGEENGNESGGSAAVKTGDVVFHGSATARLWKVLTEGLRNMSHTRYMAHGAASGPGIYLADEPNTSYSYSGSFFHAWDKTAFRSMKVLLGCELVPQTKPTVSYAGTKPPAGTHTVTDESRVLVRYVFICPGTFAMPIARHVDNAMKTTYAQLRAGP